MNTYVLRFTTKGIKNIDKLTSVDFYNNSISKGKTINLDKKNVKGIFGINGAGKSAYMLAMDIYNTMTIKSDYLVQDVIKNKLEKLINKSTKELFLENIFAVSKEDDDYKIYEVLKHTIIINYFLNDFNQKTFSVNEKLERLIGNTINSEYEEIYRVNGGQLVINDKFPNNDWYLYEYSNRLEQSTLVSYTLNSISKSLEEKLDNKKLLWYLFVSYYNSSTTKVFIDNEDLQENFILDDVLIKKNDKAFDLFKKKEKYVISFKIMNDIVKKDKFDAYTKQVNKLKEFIQILKPNLKDIRIDSKIDGDYYRCNKVFVYDDYEVDEDCESTGIKRIIKMYAYINLAIKGAKVFIDELDANISGVFLDKFLEFFAENGRGQLCFTSHNILSMNILKQYKNAITVFGETGKVVNVVKNGHYQPVNLFYEGFIEDSPFNINSFDFFKSFGLEE